MDFQFWNKIFDGFLINSQWTVGMKKNWKTSKATVNDARYKVSRKVKLVETVEIKVECHFYFYYALVGLFSANFFF